MMTFQEQLEIYPQIRELLLTKPPAGPPAISPPWRVYVQKKEDGPWARKDFHTYKSAFDFFKLKRHVWRDVSITSKRQRFEPPGRVVRIVRGGQPVWVNTPTGKRRATRLVPIKPPPEHLWCMYCRRFTVFAWFTSHHAHRGEHALLMDPTARRCAVCGTREETAAYRR